MKGWQLGVCTIIVAYLLIPASLLAAQSTFGCRVLMDIGWRSAGEQMNISQEEVGSVFANVSPASYLRTTFTTADKRAGGKIELGVFSASNMSRTHGGITVKLRYAYGWWRAGNWKLTAGQTDNWFGSTSFAPKQAVGLDYGHFLLLGWGMLWPGLVPQISAALTDGRAGLQVALEEPRASRITFWGANTCTISWDLPRISLTFRYKNQFVAIAPGISWARVKLEGVGTHLRAWAAVVPIKVRFSRAIIKFQAHYGANFALEYPFYPSAALPQQLSNGVLSDTTCWGGMVSLELGTRQVQLVLAAGYERFSNPEAWSTSRGFAADSTSRTSWVVGLPWKVRGNFTIHPELACYDYGDDPRTGKHQGHEWIAGVQFRLIF